MMSSNLHTLLALAVLCVHSTTHATEPSAMGAGSVAAGAASGGSMHIGSNGSSLSYAASSQTASFKTVPSTFHSPNYSTVTASIAGSTATNSAGVAYNTGTGSGTGTARAAGTASAAAQGLVGIHGLRTGDSGGRTGTQSTFVIQAGGGQGSSVLGSTSSGFQAALSFDRTHATTVQAATAGHVTGTNATNTLAGMNAAGLASIQSSGYFQVTGNASTSTGALPRP